MPVPCGRCPKCVNARVNSWAFRISRELEVSKNPLFITLTYDDNHLVYGDDGATLYKRHLQLFFKRLRKFYSKIYPNERLRYYACGEYGTRFGRPHYHILLFNLLQPDLVDKCWGNGFTLTLPLQDGGIPYVLKYMAKSSFARTDGRQPPFSLMSKGLGSNYIYNTDGSFTANARFHYASLDNSFVRVDGKFKLSIPKYYRDKLYTDSSPITKEDLSDFVKRFFVLEKEKFDLYSQHFPDLSNDEIENILINVERNVSYPKRLNEVFSSLIVWFFIV